MGDLRPKGGEIASLVDRRAAHMAVEVAIRTFRQAEGPMDIDPKSRVGGRGPVGARGGRDHATNHCSVMPANRGPRQRGADDALSSQRLVAGLSGADAHRPLDRKDENLAVADLAG